ncbi:hypothetical protein G6F31_019557 [Rhizopus arrhizus]|nr:hypothetical protein G6F31_019557 [Rhizopus arrhizus]
MASRAARAQVRSQPCASDNAVASAARAAATSPFSQRCSARMIASLDRRMSYSSRSLATARGSASTRRSVSCQSPPGVRTSSAADHCPLRWPPAAWPASSAASRRAASAPRDSSKLRCMAASTSGPARPLP